MAEVEKVDDIAMKEEKDEEEVTEVVKPTIFTIEILKLIKDAQQQHGLRHGDYQRYRGYCTRRIRRLRKVLKITQGEKRHFKKKVVTAAMIRDERFLYIPLMLAERAWSYAMQLRQESNTEPRKRFHLIARLRKASGFAIALELLCADDRTDARTRLEASAYAAWIQGVLHFETQRWPQAMEMLKKAQTVYERLAAALPEEQRPPYVARIEELAPSLRYCAYNMGGGGAIEDLLAMRGAGVGGLLSDLDSLVAQTREAQSQTMAQVDWRGRKISARPEKVRLFLITHQQLEPSLAQAQDVTEKLSLLETALMDVKEAVGAARDEARLRPSPAMVQLLTYLAHLRLETTLKRNLLMAVQAQSKNARPQDLTRLYEIVLQNLQEMATLSGLEDDVEYQQQLRDRTSAYRAFRCFHIAESLVSLARWTEAVALYQRARHYAKEAVNLDSELTAELATLVSTIAGREFNAHARSVLEGAEPGSKPVAATTNMLSLRLDEYREDPALTTRAPNVCCVAPDFEPVPCKPLFFDLGLNLVAFPSLDDKVDGKKAAPAAGITGFVKGLWGWNK